MTSDLVENLEDLEGELPGGGDDQRGHPERGRRLALVQHLQHLKQ